MTAFAPAQLDQHAGALRRLARVLVRDAHAADDLVQETWLRALQSPPPRAGDIGAWLRTVLRSLAGKARRTAARRSEREAAVARDEGLPDPDALAERQRSLAALIRAVGALPPAQQTCVWLRYFDGLPPRAIAAQLGVPVATVHSRLLRAHAALRVKLSDDGRDQRWALALSGALGLPLSSTAIGTATLGSAALMTMNKKLLFGLVAGIAIGLVGLRLLVPPIKTPLPVGAQEPAVLSMRDGPPLADAAARAPLPDVPLDEAVAPQPFRFALDILALDRHDLPVAGTSVLLGVPGHPMNVAGKTDDHGRLHVEWHGRQAAMDVLVGESQGLKLRRVMLAAGSARTVCVRPHRSRILEVAFSGSGIEARHSPGFLAATAPAMDRLSGDLRRFVTPATRSVRRESSDEPTLVGAHMLFAGREGVEISAARTLSGVVRDAAGRPVPECAVASLGSESGPVHDLVTTDAQGRFALEVGVGTALVRAGGGPHGIAWQRVDVSEASSLTWDPQLERGYELKGFVLDAEGKALAGWRIEIEIDAPGEPFLKSGTTDERGHFAIPNVPLTSCFVRAFHPDCESIPAHTFLPQMPGAGEVSLEVPTSNTVLGPLALLACTREQHAVPGTEFVVLADQAAHGVRLRGDGVGGAPAIALPVGTYLLQAIAPGRVARTLATVRQTAAAPMPEAVWLDDPVRLSLRAPSGYDTVLSQVVLEVVIRINGLDPVPVVSGEGRTVEEQEWALAPGEYLIESPTGRRRVLLRAGEPQTLDLTESSKAPR